MYSCSSFQEKVIGPAEPFCESILVIEDDPSLRELLKEILEYDNYKVLTAENGLEGLEKLQAAPAPCLVLLDMMMPIMTGREFLDKVRATRNFADIPIYIVSANATKAQMKGADGFFQKPLEFDLLSALVGRFVKPSRRVFT